MALETIEYCNAHLDEYVANLFNDATDRMKAHNAHHEAYGVGDNPDAIAEELNSLLPWVIEHPEVHFENRGGQVVAIKNT